MARGRKKRIIQSQDEYLSEKHIGRKSPNKNGAPSVLYPSTGEDQSVCKHDTAVVTRGPRNSTSQNSGEYISEDYIQQGSSEENGEASEFDPTSGGEYLDRDGDVELNIQDESEEIPKRGRTKLKHVWNLPTGHRIVVNCNELDQPIGEEAGVLGKFLGMVARNGCLCSLSFKDWRLLIGKKERDTDEQKNKQDIFNQVKRFLYPTRMEKWILRTIGERWRQHKPNLKSIYFDAHKTKDANYNNVPQGVLDDQWIALVNNWMTLRAQEISEANRINCAKKKATHTSGPKSFARNREDLRERDPENKYPHRAVLNIHTHQTNSKKNTNAHVGELKDMLAQHPDLADTSQGKVAWKGDALNRILGEEKPGHVHGLGLVPNPDKVFDSSTSRRLKHLNLTTLDATSSEDVASLRLQVERLGNRVHNQDATIHDLHQKTITLEKQQRKHGCLDDPLLTPKDVEATAKRKRVYGGSQSQEFRMHEELNYTRMEENDDDEYEDLQPHYKYTSTIDKTKTPNGREENLLHANRVSAAREAKTKKFHTDIGLDNIKRTNLSKVMDQEISSNFSTYEESSQQPKHKTKRRGLILHPKYASVLMHRR